MSALPSLRDQIRRDTHKDENRCVRQLLNENFLNQKSRDHILLEAKKLVEYSRNDVRHQGTLDAFLQEFGLSNEEGIALMCLAEALLRVPDAATADKLIAEKVTSGDWVRHLGRSKSIFVNASTWSLMLTGKIIHSDSFKTDSTWYESLINQLGEPIIRQAMLQAMRILGGQYVLGRKIEEAMIKGLKENRQGTRFSFDMLGEGARTQSAAQRYFAAYLHAIHRIGKSNTSDDVYQADGISVKLSALHPRYEFAQLERVMNELLPKLIDLAETAKYYNIGFTIDAEEADRLDISLSLFERLAKHATLCDWSGLGFVLQAYQKRAPAVAHWLIALATETRRKIMVRLVKGAYWDTEIKHAQERGLEDYPVFTRKVNTDLSYQTCAQILFGAPKSIYPQFATHNAYSIAMAAELGKGKQFEFQRLHGMGYLLYEELHKLNKNSRLPIRVYAPVGAHKDLLPYLVRRLLENGANSSFVNRFMDESTPVDRLIHDTVDQATANTPYRHPQIPLPANLFQQTHLPRQNARGLDLNHPTQCGILLNTIREFGRHHFQGGSIVSGKKIGGNAAIKSPANATIVGYSSHAELTDIHQALDAAHLAQKQWDKQGGETRAQILEKVADCLESDRDELIALMTYEAGKTLPDCIDEVREAVDFCRYYANLAREHFTTALELPGPTGEHNALSLHGRGVFICISPWNFPLAIFMGQITAALAAGNAVIAKPAEQTPLIAAKAVNLMLRAGVPAELLHLINGDGNVGAALVREPKVAGVVFTGSTETAKRIQLALAHKDGPIIPFIAETGGQNAMIVDSTAPLEHVVDDIIASAFKSAGQRCSALRVLFLQKDIADTALTMVREACDQLTLGHPWQLKTDIGPVIDTNACSALRDHITKMRNKASLVYAYPQDKTPTTGSFLGPHIFELSSLTQLRREVFGPILHVIRYDAQDLDEILHDINNTGYGLTLGIHTRIESEAAHIFSRTNVGNTYVNRNMVGAVVGVHPFGGQGLSGTGPKAGGPFYLWRFASEKTFTVNTVATGGNAELLSLEQ